MGFGRNGDRLAKTPTRVLPPSLGGRTVGNQNHGFSTACIHMRLYIEEDKLISCYHRDDTDPFLPFHKRKITGSDYTSLKICDRISWCFHPPSGRHDILM